MDDSILIFLHIPKTAGSTLGKPLHRQYPQSQIFLIDGNFPERSVQYFISLPVDERRRYRCISGHIPLGLHREMPEAGRVVYTTILREPVNRIISLYYHILQEKTHYLYPAVALDRMSLLEFVNSQLSSEISDDQTRRLSGMGGWNQKTDQTRIDESGYQAALENIERFFPVVGLTEYFDESLLLMKDAFSWGNCLYSRRKVSTNRPPKNEIDPQTIAAIKAQNQYDLRLYEYARQRLESQIRQKGAFFQKRVQWFQYLNGRYNFLRDKRSSFPLSFVWFLSRKAAAFQCRTQKA